MTYTLRNASRIKLFDRTRIWKRFFFQSIFSIEMSFSERNVSKSNSLADGPSENASYLINFVNRDELYWAKRIENQSVWQNPHLEKTAFSNQFCQSRWAILSETHLKKTDFWNPSCQSRWAILSETIQKSNGLADGPTEKTSFLITFVNGDELYWAKRFKNQTVWQNPYLKNLLFLIHFLNRDEVYWTKRIWKKLLFRIPFVNRDELYWAKRCKNETLWQMAHLKMFLF